MIIPILATLLLAYCISSLCFLLMSGFNRHLRKIRPRYLSTANIIVALAGILMLVFLAIDLRKAPAHSANTTSLVPIGALHLAAGLLTFFPKLRRSVFFTLMLIAVYTFCLFREAIYVFFTSFSRDYLPSSWSYYRSASDLYILVYAAVYLAICYFIAAKPVSGSRR
ncbi:hypothetical protein [Chitinophaga filiformis]|uniref:Uncharacterized protein n=1 Tax=Chitinophaga filiformis TaxID=104663 RepID=A0ABY4I701_CHIFI|nr:hypothetical protein [Chitinophaga filiformis]UPK71024.1 hypothetical protein MYF79_06900 [Chitinophaga filiformis]